MLELGVFKKWGLNESLVGKLIGKQADIACGCGGTSGQEEEELYADDNDYDCFGWVWLSR